MSHWVYLGLLAVCLIGTAPLEIWLHTHVYRRWQRLLATLLPVVLIFGGWDLLAIAHRDWSYNRHFLVGVTLPGGLPLEELLFFLVTPTCAILTLEAVRARRPQWPIGDEPVDGEGHAPGQEGG
ncbi:lycopene cyclase domain-containing protein [Jatrophihabitans sp. GAS493]|uniref:lycopene cyclase domain-containing protein n=1 Tax=Jatrophihabitans sp. GAS493 TaxID=1907575 RepID=UPI000BB82FCB|nr:lycopene cyclase domain-containing protein [Jatrophihabitans sp. GAS493]SOD74355.1 lycopene cyclase domain-containing protein [Jatrophihabitans sp. GAS493]